MKLEEITRGARREKARKLGVPRFGDWEDDKEPAKETEEGWQVGSEPGRGSRGGDVGKARCQSVPRRSI